MRRLELTAAVTKPPYNADNTGASDASAAINKALADCPAEEVVYLPGGKYRLTSQVNGPHNVMNLWEGNIGSQFQADGLLQEAGLAPESSRLEMRHGGPDRVR